MRKMKMILEDPRNPENPGKNDDVPLPPDDPARDPPVKEPPQRRPPKRALLNIMRVTTATSAPTTSCCIDRSRL